MIVKANYNECLTNLACSIRKYFELEAKHNSLPYVDQILEEYQPKNVVTILCDGMGSHIMDKALTKEDFLMQNRLKTISSVFPPTTVAATTAMITGLNPVESGMLGWYMYYKDLDQVITTYRSSAKNDPYDVPIKEAEEYFKKHMKVKPITQEIREKGKDRGIQIFPFGEDSYTSLDEMFERIYKTCNGKGKKYIYSYDTEPDHTMHKLGCDSEEAYEIIRDLNKRIESLSRELRDTILLVVADHGHLNVEKLYLNDYPEIMECLRKDTSIDARAINFFIKKGMEKEFEERFQRRLSEYFELHKMREVIESKLFGDGEENEIFRDALGDYLAIGTGNKTLLHRGATPFKSHHSGYTQEELEVPLVLIKTRKQ